MIIIKLKIFLAAIAASTLIFSYSASVFAQTNTDIQINTIETITNGDLVINLKGTSDSELLKTDSDVPAAQSTELPEKYNSDLTALANVSTVKNQGSNGLCWDFAATACMESALMAQGKSEYDFSELHTAYALSSQYSNYTREYSSGGNTLYSASAYTLKNSADDETFGGIISENALPYETADTDVTLYALDVDSSFYPAYFSDLTYYSGSTVEMLDETTRSARNEMIKEKVYNYGAVEACIYCGETAGNASQGFFVTENGDKVFYYNAPVESNHSVTIVGYDDTYSKENFAQFADYLSTGDGYYPTTPENDGAFIVKNSWGSSWGNNGYFYMSYDTVIPSVSCFSDIRENTRGTDSQSFDNVYSYTNELPNSYSGGFSTDSYYTATGANVFKTNNENESVTQLSTYIFSGDTYIRFYIDSNAANGEFDEISEVSVNPALGTESAVFDDKNWIYVKEPGLYVFSLTNPVQVTGSEFTVFCQYASSDETNALIPFEGSGSGNFNFTSSAGHSYISAYPLTTSFSDLYSYFNSDGSVPFSVFLRAYTQNTGGIDITIDGVDKTVSRGETYTSDLYYLNSAGYYVPLAAGTPIIDKHDYFTAEYMGVPAILSVNRQTSSDGTRYVAEISTDTSSDLDKITDLGFILVPNEGNLTSDAALGNDRTLYSQSVGGYTEKKSDNSLIFTSENVTDSSYGYVRVYMTYTKTNGDTIKVCTDKYSIA